MQIVEAFLCWFFGKILYLILQQKICKHNLIILISNLNAFGDEFLHRLNDYNKIFDHIVFFPSKKEEVLKWFEYDVKQIKKLIYYKWCKITCHDCSWFEKRFHQLENAIKPPTLFVLKLVLLELCFWFILSQHFI